MRRPVGFFILFSLAVSPVFAAGERLACQDGYEQAYNLSMDAIDDSHKAPQAVKAQNDFDACLSDYESKHGKQAREDLSKKLSVLEP